jgi:hypothetical protein
VRWQFYDYQLMVRLGRPELAVRPSHNPHQLSEELQLFPQAPSGLTWYFTNRRTGTLLLTPEHLAQFSWQPNPAYRGGQHLRFTPDAGLGTDWFPYADADTGFSERYVRLEAVRL